MSLSNDGMQTNADGSGGSLYLRRTAITALPSNLKVGGKIYGLEPDITPARPDEMCGGRAA
jgi:hypothetical protein